MKFVVDADVLRKALAAPAHVAVDHLHLSVTDGTLSVTGDDTVVRVTERRPVHAAIDGDAYIGAALFHDLAKVMPPGPVTVEASGPLLELSGGDTDDTDEPVRAAVYAAAPSAISMPAEPPPPPPVGEVEMAAFNSAMAQVVPAAAAPHSENPLLASVSVRASRGSLVFAATDLYRLHTTRSRLIDAGAWSHEALIPIDAVKLAASVFPDDDEPLVALNRELFSMRTDATTITSRLVQGQFPSWQAKIPHERDRTATVALDAEALLAALSRVAPIARLGDKGVSVTAVPEDRLIVVKARADDTGESSASFRAHTVTGAAFTFFAPLRWLTDAVKCARCQRLNLYWVADRAPLLINGFGSDYQALVSPLRPTPPKKGPAQ